MVFANRVSNIVLAEPCQNDEMKGGKGEFG